MRYITIMGMVWRMSDRAYRRLLADIANGDGADPEHTPGAKCLGAVDDHTETTAEQAAELLADIECRETDAR